MAYTEGSSFQTCNSMSHFSISKHHRTLELQGILMLFLSKYSSIASVHNHQAVVTQPLLEHFQSKGSQHLQTHFAFLVGKRSWSGL